MGNNYCCANNDGQYNSNRKFDYMSGDIRYIGTSRNTRPQQLTSGTSYRQAAMQAINRDVERADPVGLRKSTTYELEMDMPNPVATTEEIFKFQNDKQDLKLQQVLIDSNNFQS